MGDGTGIEWTEATWNPIRGCSHVSEGCRNCYAEKVAARFSGPGLAYEGLTRDGKWNGSVRVIEKHLEDPLHWTRPRRIFVNSMSDLFHESLSLESILRIFDVMWEAKHHTFQVLTKRPKRALEFCRAYGLGTVNKWPSNVWLGVSVENQAAADERIPLLLETPAAVRFLSMEPLLGSVDLNRIDATKAGWRAVNGFADEPISAFRKWQKHPTRALLQNGVDWVIVGGESGHGVRAMHPDWARSLRDQCADAGTAFFFKQWGEWAPQKEYEHPEAFSHHSAGEIVSTTTVSSTDRRQIGERSFYAVGERKVERLKKLGKHATGSLLDGVEHKAFPEVANG